MKIKEYVAKDNVGREIEISIPDLPMNLPMIKTYITAIRANLRQWSASTLTRGEVNRTGKKCRKQKGTGGARHGDRAAPQMRKGGRAHGPEPKFDQHVKINAKERRSAIRSLLVDKISSGRLFHLPFDALELFSELPKTKRAVDILGAFGILGQKNLLLFGSFSDEHFLDIERMKLSFRNIPDLYMGELGSLSGYDLLRNRNVILVASSREELNNYLEA